ncbi:MAG TPA: ABC transporter permease, partial [Planctomycetota bacterium]|nr:ABC transporter permease [Planctomycetota bacterium]
SAKLVEALRSASTLKVEPAPGETAVTAAELRSKVADGEAHHALIVPKGYGAEIAAGRLPAVTLVRDPGREMESQMVSVGLTQAFFSSAGVEMAPLLTARALEAAGLPPAWRGQALAASKLFSASVNELFAASHASSDGAASRSRTPDVSKVMFDIVPVVREDVAPPDRPKRVSYVLAQSVSGVTLMMLMFGLMACSSLLIKERDERTLDRLLLSPAPRDAMLLGKLLFMAAMGAMQLVVLFVVGELVFGIGILRDLPSLAIVSAVVLLAVTGFGILIAAWAKTTKQAEGLSTLLILVMCAVGGAWFPIQMLDLPLPAEIATRSTITYWAMRSYQGIFWYGKSWTDPSTLSALGVLLAFSAVAIALARALYRRRYVGA